MKTTPGKVPRLEAGQTATAQDIARRQGLCDRVQRSEYSDIGALRMDRYDARIARSHKP